MSGLHWRGSEIKAAAPEVARAAIDEVTKAAAEDAAHEHWWNARRGERGLAGQIEHEPAVTIGTETVGKFGSTARRGFYGLFLERREPWLRPAADRVFPTLARVISAKWRL